MVTHDAQAASIGDRTLFLADGLVMKELRASSPHDLLSAMEEVSA
jgi:putative ABC transport system ATP-binding protein